MSKSFNVVIDEADSDAGGLTFSYFDGPRHGTITSITTNNSTSYVTVTITYKPNPGYSGSDSFGLRALESTYAKPYSCATATIPIQITAVDEAPTAPPQTLGVTDGRAYRGQLFSQDPDGQPVTSYAVATNPAHGTLQLDTASSAFIYTPVAGYNGADTFTYRATAGSLTSSAGTISFRVCVLDDPPVLTTSSGQAAAAGMGPAVAIDPNLLVSDDSASLVWAKVWFTANYVPGQDLLEFPGYTGITSSFDPAAGRLSLTGSVSPASYQAALRLVTYRNTQSNPSTVARTVAFTVTDSLNTSLAATRQIAVLDTAAPAALSIQRLDPETTQAGAVRFGITWDEGVMGVDASDFTVATTDTAAWSYLSVEGAGAGRTVTVSGISGAGTLGLTLVRKLGTLPYFPIAYPV